MVVLSADILPQLRLTVDEYLQADLPEGNRYELVDGVIEVSPTPEYLHDHVLGELHRALILYQVKHPHAFDHISQRAGLVIPGQATVREPDLALYRDIRPIEGYVFWKESLPFWIAEATSPRQERRDLEEKRENYWRAGIDEYWIVHRSKRRVVVLSRGQDAWIEQVFTMGQDARSVVLPDFSLPVAKLFPQP
jgi:Uma2 family endonuclease